MSFRSHRLASLVSFCLAATSLLASPGTLAADSNPEKAPASVAERLDSYARLVVLDGIDVEDLQLPVAHLTIKLFDGTVYPLRSAGGVPLGFYFEGSAAYDYESVDPVDRALIAKNFERHNRSDMVRSHVVHDIFERGLFIGTGDWFAAAANATGEARDLDETVQGHLNDFVERFPYEAWAPIFLEAEMNGHFGIELAFADIEGKRENVWYELDRLRAKSERLEFRWRRKGTKIWGGEPVSVQFLDGGPTPESAPLRLVHLGLDIETEDNRSGSIDSDLVLQVRADGLRLGCFILENHRDREAEGWNDTRRPLQVSRVVDSDGSELDFVHRYRELLVDFGKAHAKGDEVKIHVETEGEVFTDLTWDHGDSYFALFGLYWFPEPYSWGGTRFTHETRVRTRKPFRPISTGSEIELKEDGDFYELVASSDDPQKNTCVFAGEYDVYSEEFDGLMIRVFSYASRVKDKPQNMAGLANMFVRFYEQMLGPYPFDELHIIEVPSYGFGVAPAGTVLLTTEAYKPHRDMVARWFSRGINARLAHEIAHLWFGHKAIWGGPREQWLSESFAEYLSGLAMGDDKGRRGRHVVNYKTIHAEWLADTKTHADYGTIAGANQVSGSRAWGVRRAMLYSRGPLVLRMLHAMTGQRFVEILRRFVDEANMGFASTEDLKRVTNQVMGFDLGWFFDQWLNEPGIPEVRVETDVRRAEGGNWLLECETKQEPATFKKIAIPVVYELGGGQRGFQILVQEKPEQRFRFELPKKPRDINVDPGGDLLARIR